MASGGSIERFDFMLLCLAIWLERLTWSTHQRGLVTIATCSSGEAGNTVTREGIVEECEHFDFVSTDF